MLSVEGYIVCSCPLQILVVQALLWLLSLVVDIKSAHWDDQIIHGLHFLEHSVLHLPFFLMTMMRHMTPTLDNMCVAGITAKAAY